MEVRVKYGSYNSRRFTRPWISKVTAWPEGGKPEVEFGSYIGDDKGGYVAISAKTGDIVRHGQRDGRQPKNNTYPWYFVNEEGKLEEISVNDARDLFMGYITLEGGV